MRAGGAGEHAHVSVAAAVTSVQMILTFDSSLGPLLEIVLVYIIRWEEVIFFSCAEEVSGMRYMDGHVGYG